MTYGCKEDERLFQIAKVSNLTVTDAAGYLCNQTVKVLEGRLCENRLDQVFVNLLCRKQTQASVTVRVRRGGKTGDGSSNGRAGAPRLVAVAVGLVYSTIVSTSTIYE